MRLAVSSHVISNPLHVHGTLQAEQNTLVQTDKAQADARPGGGGSKGHGGTQPTPSQKAAAAPTSSALSRSQPSSTRARQTALRVPRGQAGVSQ